MENALADHYFGDMVGHFGAFSKYGALLIAGKNDDRGATEFYDNYGFKIGLSFRRKIEYLLKKISVIEKSSTDAWTTKTNTSFLEFVYGFTAVQLQAGTH